MSIVGWMVMLFARCWFIFGHFCDEFAQELPFLLLKLKSLGEPGTCGNDKELSNRYMSKLLGDHGAEKKTQKKQKLLFQGSLKLPIWEEWNMHYKCMVNLNDFAFNSALFGLVIYIIYIDVCIYIYIYWPLYFTVIWWYEIAQRPFLHTIFR